MNTTTYRRFPTGAWPAPRHKLLAAHPHQVFRSPPPQLAMVPAKLDMWGNDRFGDCVTAEEAFAKACYSPEVFIDAQTVIAWAQQHGFLNGADLPSVMDAMIKDGFVVGSQRYNNGPYNGVDYSNETILQSAISSGTEGGINGSPVNIGIMSSALPSGAGNQQGWFALGPGPSGPQDHCVSLSGYGPAGWLYSVLNTVLGNVPLPTGLSPTQQGYLLFTWSTIGFVDHAWIMGACGEAWVRNPTTVGIPPLPGPQPPPPPPPPPPPGTINGSGVFILPAGNYNQADGPIIAVPSILVPAGNYPAFNPTPPPPPPPPPNPALDQAIAESQDLTAKLEALRGH